MISRPVRFGTISPHATQGFIVILAGLFISQLCFTAMIRLVVEPRLRPALHWQHGLARDSDSAFFYTEGVIFRTRLHTEGWGALLSSDVPGQGHVKFIGSVFYLTNTTNPWSIFVLNAVASCISVVLLSRSLAALGIGRGPARLIAAGLALSPIWLFHHSELLREPYVAIAFNALLYSAVCLLTPRQAAIDRRTGWLLDALSLAVLAGSYTVLVWFRPYLLLLVLLLLVVMFVVVLAWQLADAVHDRPGWERVAVFGASVVIVFFTVVRPEMRMVRAYAESTSETASSVAAARRWAVAEARAAAEAGHRQWRREDVTALSAPCAIGWRRAGWVPVSIEEKLLAISCARQEFQRSCDVTVLGRGADQNCDQATLASTADFIRHFPAAVAFSLLTPFPNMWVAGFGSGGTGLRRVGYVVDGLLAYALLTGLLMLLRMPHGTRAVATALAAGLVTMMLVYGYSVPTQFILARMRLTMYVPLLALGAAAWWVSNVPARLRQWLTGLKPAIERV